MSLTDPILFWPSLVPWLFAWALLLPPKGLLRRTSAPAAHGSHLCPSCGGAVDLEDYLPSASEIGCSHCNARFPRSAASVASIALLLLAIAGHAEPARQIKVKFPPGFEVEAVASGKHDAADRDVHVAAAAHPGGCRVDLYFDSSVPLTNDQIPAFGQQLMASATERLPSMRLGSPGVVTEKARE